jgi:hypothetical protein
VELVVDVDACGVKGVKRPTSSEQNRSRKGDRFLNCDFANSGV